MTNQFKDIQFVVIAMPANGSGQNELARFRFYDMTEVQIAGLAQNDSFLGNIFFSPV
jgi:hypothetical protein